MKSETNPPTMLFLDMDFKIRKAMKSNGCMHKIKNIEPSGFIDKDMCSEITIHLTESSITLSSDALTSNFDESMNIILNSN